MTQEDKFKLVISFLNKLIVDKSDVDVSSGIWKNYILNHKRYNDGSNNSECFCISVSENELTYYVPYVFKMKMSLSDEQLVEFKYNFNKLFEISEEKAIKSLEEF